MAIQTNTLRQVKARYLEGLSGTALERTGIPAEAIMALEHALVGCVALPGTARYGTGNPLYPAHPKLIVFCKVFEDVRQSLAFAHEHDLSVTCRSGGHSTAGYSVNDGMVIDVSEIDYVVVDRERMRARAGAGARFHNLNAELDTYRVHLPSGTCPDVAAGGFMMGGGYGLTSREFGMGCDSIVEATVMLADGSIVIANESTNADLHWAIRGGTGDQFGVLLDLTFGVHDLWKLWGFAVAWPLENAPEALVALQEGYMGGGSGPKEVGHLTVMQCQEADFDKKALVMIGVFDGTREALDGAIAPLWNTTGARWATYSVGPDAGKEAKPVFAPYAILNDALFAVLPGVPGGKPADMKDPKPLPLQPPDSPVSSACDASHQPPPGPAVFEVKDSGYIGRNLTAAEWREITDYYATTPNPYNVVGIEPYGGAIDAYPVTKSAFVHRDVSMDFIVDSFWVEGWRYNGDDEARQWLAGFIEAARPFFNGHKYQNYPIRDLPDYRWAYWGDAFPTLLQVKQKYDPDGFFHFEQSITPYPDGDGITRSTASPLFQDSSIEREAWGTPG